jgi:peptidylprolyl isomerase
MGEKMKVENGSNVKVHYKGTLKDGSVFDESKVRGKPLSFTIGSGNMLKKFNDTVADMSIGEVKNITCEPEEAYGYYDSSALHAVQKERFGPDFEFKKGNVVRGDGPLGPFVAKIHEIEEERVVLDFNHPLAGEQLNFEIQLIEVEASPEEDSQPVGTWSASMKKAELLDIAREQGLEVNTRSTKAQIVEALSAQ